MDFDWRKLLAGLAPTLASALGGPLAGLAVREIADKMLGDPEASEADVAAAITSGQLTGEQIVALKQADQAFALRMRELDIDLEKLNQAAEEARLHDVQDARAREVSTGDTTPKILLWVLLTLWMATFACFYLVPLPTDEFLRALIVRAYSTVEIGVTTALAYFIGSSRGSKQSGDAVREIALKAK